jgi:5'-3' exonuclease
MSKNKSILPLIYENVILIDTSYTSFHRFYATLKWFSMVEPELYKEYYNNPEYNWIENTIFFEKYKKMYFDKIEKSVGKKIFKKSIIIFCMDTPKEQVWRTTELSIKYKCDRADLSLKNNFKPIFKYTYNILIPGYIKEHNNIFKIRINKLEADDIIGIIAKYLEQEYTLKKIFIMSGDRDFYQLGRENVCFINYKNKKPIIFNKEQAQTELHKKILLGDKSDCITSIFPNKFSIKLKKELILSIDKFNEFIKENKLIEEKYINNNKLINFDFIPTHYKNDIINEFKNILNIMLTKNKKIIF